MNLNATLLGQFITFALFVWFTMKYVWPPITKAMEERKKTIADGLAAAQRGQHELELARHKALEILRDAKLEAAEVIDKASKRVTLMIEDGKEASRQEALRMIELGKSEIDRELKKAKLVLKERVASIALEGAERILSKNIDKAVNSEIIDKLITEIEC